MYILSPLAIHVQLFPYIASFFLGRPMAWTPDVDAIQFVSVVDAIQLVWMVSAFGNQKSTYSLSPPFLPRPAGRGKKGGDYFWLPNLLTIDARSYGVDYHARSNGVDYHARSNGVVCNQKC